MLAFLPYALLYDLVFAVPALLRAGARPALPSRFLLVACWVLPVLAVVIRHQVPSLWPCPRCCRRARRWPARAAISGRPSPAIAWSAFDRIVPTATESE